MLFIFFFFILALTAIALLVFLCTRSEPRATVVDPDDLAHATRLIEKVKKHMQWSYAKTHHWFCTPNPLLGNVAPFQMVLLGRVRKLEKFIDNLIDESTMTSGDEFL